MESARSGTGRVVLVLSIRRHSLMRSQWIWYLGRVLLWGSCVGIAWSQTTVLCDFTTARETVPSGWELTVKSGEASLQLVQDEGKQALRMRSEQTSFALQKQVQIPLQGAPFLVWQWKVTEIPKGGDFRRSRTDDQ